MSQTPKASEEKLSVLYYAQQKFIRLRQLNFLKILFTLGPAESCKSEELFPEVSRACHSDPTSEAWGNGEGNCISLALPDLQCSELLRWVRSRCQEYRSKEEKETSCQAGPEMLTSSIFPSGKVQWRFRIYMHLLSSVTFLPLPFKQPLQVLMIWISNSLWRKAHLTWTGVVCCRTTRAWVRAIMHMLMHINVSTCWGTFGKFLQQPYCIIKTSARLSLVPVRVYLVSGFHSITE